MKVYVIDIKKRFFDYPTVNMSVTTQAKDVETTDDLVIERVMRQHKGNLTPNKKDYAIRKIVE